MASQNHGNTIYLTEQEAERIRAAAKERLRKCLELAGHARESRDSKAAISQATGASLMADMGSMTVSKAELSTLPALVVGQPYPPCIAPFPDLQPMTIANLRLETHHRGHQLTVKRATPVVILSTRSWAMVQDESGETERLEIVLHRSRHGKDVLESASTFIIKEPYFTLTEEGEPTLRIDHLSDLVVPNQDDKTPQSPTAEEASKIALARKQKGNAALQKSNLPLAQAYYTSALALTTHLPSPSLAQDLHRNRAHVNLLLSEFDAAKSDALAALINPASKGNNNNTHDDDDEDATRTAELDAKAYFRAASAAYQLGHFREAQALFEKQLHLPPHDKGAIANLARTQARLREQGKGVYDFARIRASVLAAAGGNVGRRVDAASFAGATEVRESGEEGKGKGLFAAKGIAAGEVVLCEKAFCVVWGHEREAVTAVTYDVRDDRIRVAPVGLGRAVVERLMGNSSLTGGVMGLFGDWQGGGGEGRDDVFGTDDGPVVDVFRVHDIVSRNAFGVGGKDGGGGGQSAGLWIRAAYINHSCIPNTEREFIGDLMVVRATKRIAAGEEIVHSYDESGDYKTRQQALMTTWGFECGCALCVAETGDDAAVRAKRGKLAAEADAFLTSPSAPVKKRLAIVKARSLAKAIDETYDEERYKGLPRLASRGIRQWLAKATA
ncbi:SET domain-containing protein [Chaetomidium leptoderma]|uniref:SET domain-containing protein n=1 Tax=Chaetomidium leptoderma TaxID=669021 RepID=A0AAN6ZSD5_9PEZI|nr:SET domain-containing protein [Chaetomidium leptoderma]